MTHDHYPSLLKLNMASAYIEAIELAKKSGNEVHNDAHVEDKEPQPSIVPSLKPRKPFVLFGAVAPRYAMVFAGVVVVSGAFIIDWIA